ncbi:hypothetical protein Ancab_004225 [Ancistrocladus abbreviatus]
MAVMELLCPGMEHHCCLVFKGAIFMAVLQRSEIQGVQGYHEAASNRGSSKFLAFSSIISQPHNLHPAPCIQGVRGYCANYHPPVAATSSRQPTNNAVQRGTISNYHDDVESLSPPSGIRMYRSHRRGRLTRGNFQTPECSSF